jgi:hypothetical protein
VRVKGVGLRKGKFAVPGINSGALPLEVVKMILQVPLPYDIRAGVLGDRKSWGKNER